MQKMVAVFHNKDFAARLLRSQISTLVDVLKEIESHHCDVHYVAVYLRRVEKNINWMRKMNFLTE